jgi:hypothetical protein
VARASSISAVDEVKPEFALDVSAIPRRMKVVAVGLESGVRIVPVAHHVGARHRAAHDPLLSSAARGAVAMTP